MIEKEPFKDLLKNSVDNLTLGELCDVLAKSNICIYYYENKKWYTNAKSKNNDNKITTWDTMSRKWNEKRNAVKNRIDTLLKKSIHNRRILQGASPKHFPYKILPISLAIDMLTIENIKIFDHTNKKRRSAIIQSQNKTKALKKYIDDTVSDICLRGKYPIEIETRTF